MGQIQNAVGSLVGSVAVGAIAKQSIGKIKEELGTTKQALKSTEEDLQLTNEAIDDGINPQTGFPLDESKAGLSRDEPKLTASNGVAEKQRQIKISQKKTRRNKVKELRKILKGGK